MTIIPIEGRTYEVPNSAIYPFMLIAFVLAWGIIALLIFFNDAITELFGAVSTSHPHFILAVYAPAIAAFAVVTLSCGPSGSMRFLGRLLLFRVSIGWWAMILIVIPAVFFAGALLKSVPLSVASFPSLGSALSAVGFMMVLGPIEEFGWRGVALPLLQRRMTPLRAGLLLGAIWGVWHLPAFFLGGTPQSTWGIFPFMIGAVAVSVILTALFNAARGSILLAALFHFQLNNPIWPDAQPYDTVLFCIIALIVVWANRQDMFTRRQAVVDVVPPA